MIKQNDVHRIGNLLGDESFVIVVEYATAYDVSPKDALNHIVQEWSQSKLIEAEETSPKNSKMVLMEHKISELTKAVDKVILKLRVASL